MQKLQKWFCLSLIACLFTACNAGKDKRQLTRPILQTEFGTGKNSRSNDQKAASYKDNTPIKEDNTLAKESKTAAKENEAGTSSSASGYNSFTDLPQAPADASAIILKREGYTVSYNTETKNPNWVAWHLTSEHTNGPYKRSGIEFHADADAPSPQVDTYDYIQSGYDRGHMCPAADNRWSQTAMEQCFLMTNMCPQNHALNAGLWNTLEIQTRKWAEKYGDVYVVSGPIFFNTNHKKIGKHKVWVPEAFFKVIVYLGQEPKGIGFVCRNEGEKGHKKTEFVNTIAQVERITGIKFFPKLSADVRKKIENTADYNQW